MSEVVDLIERAQRVVDGVKANLELPQHETVHYDYKVQLTEKYNLAVRLHTAPWHDPLRYVYLSHSNYLGGSRPDAAVDIDAVLCGHEVKDGIRAISTINTVLSELDDSAERTLLAQILNAFKLYRQGEAVERGAEVRVNTAFGEVLQRGSFARFRESSLTHDDGTELTIKSTDINGSPEHVAEYIIHEPQIEIAVHEKAKDHRVVVCEGEQGALESWSELADWLERGVRKARPNNIYRDASGKIIGFTIPLADKIAMQKSERAAGLRALEVGRVALAEYYVDELLNPLASEK